jgi:hypothetical protein
MDGWVMGGSGREGRRHPARVLVHGCSGEMADLLEDLVGGELDAAGEAVNEDERADALVEAERAVVAHDAAAGAEEGALGVASPGAARSVISGRRGSARGGDRGGIRVRTLAGRS